MYEIKLTKLSTNPNALRTNEVDGFCGELPVEGESFLMLGKGVEFGIRMVTTSIIKKISNAGKKEIVFDTLNSTYSLEIYNGQ